MVLMEFVPNYRCHTTVNKLITQGLIRISTTCWLLRWLEVICVPINRRGIEGLQCIGQKLSASWNFSHPFLHNFSDACVVEPVGTVYLNLQNIYWGPQTLHYPWCGVLVLIPVFLTCYEFSLYHLEFRAKIIFLSGVVRILLASKW